MRSHCRFRLILLVALAVIAPAQAQQTDRAQYDKLIAESRRLTADYTRDFATFDAEAIAAVDKFREDKNLNDQGNPPGLVDDRLVATLRSAYFAKKKAAQR